MTNCFCFIVNMGCSIGFTTRLQAYVRSTLINGWNAANDNSYHRGNHCFRLRRSVCN